MNDPVLIPHTPIVSTEYRPVQLAENPLTKREEFAKAAMQGLCANPALEHWLIQDLAQRARKQADALIAELDAHPNP